MHACPLELAPFLASLPPGARVLDLGSGTGRQAEAVRSAGFSVCALDFDVDALSTARSLYPGLAACAGRAEASPFAAAVFDGVVCIDVLHWCADARAFEAAWRGAWEVLRPGGIFLARLRIREFASESEGWFLAERRMLEQLAARAGGEWLMPITQDGDSGCFALKKTD